MAMASRSELERYAEDILVNTLKRSRYQFSTRDALADKLGKIVSELNRAADRSEARRLVNK